MIALKVDTVTFDELSQMGIVLLVTEDNKRALPIWIGLFEAQSILFKLQGSFFPRPLTHDLLKNCIEQLGGKVEYILINDLNKNTFFAEIHIKREEKEIIVDSRPSDAIAIAVRAEAPIYVSEKIFEESSVEKEDFLREQKEKIYKTYLESLDDDEIGKLKH